MHKDLSQAGEDKSKIESLGPYALCLSYILSYSKYPENSESFYVYRSMMMTEQEF